MGRSLRRSDRSRHEFRQIDMSLNYREIDHVLEELKLEGARIENIYQPDRYSLLLETWSPGRKQNVLIGLHHGAVRILRTGKKLPHPPQPPRFTQLLRARVKGGFILSAEQPGGERLIRLVVRCRENVYTLWFRLWSGNPNIILTDHDGRIVDVLFRKKEAGETGGGFFRPDSGTLSGNRKKPEAPIREYSGYPDLCACIDDTYGSSGTPAEVERKKEILLKRLGKRSTALRSRIAGLEIRKSKYSAAEEQKKLGELVRANIWRIRKGDELLIAEDYESGGPVSIPLDGTLTAAENSEAFFRLYSKYRKGLERVEGELISAEQELKKAEELTSRVQNCSDPPELTALEEEYGSVPTAERVPEKLTTGLLFHSGDFEILVGRNARENDELLRRSVKGNDIWLHVRDFPGGYVFIKSRKGKSVPLETLLDGANLALLYCSGKRGSSGDVHYAEVKNLRRIKDGKTGQVSVTRDRNLFVQFDSSRIKKLQGRSGLESDVSNPDN